MVNLIQAKEQFAAYCKGYDTQDERVALKIVHSQKVAEISKQLAIHRNCSAMDVDLAEVTGLYHDIGRFEQLKQYHTFLDAKKYQSCGTWGTDFTGTRAVICFL